MGALIHSPDFMPAVEQVLEELEVQSAGGPAVEPETAAMLGAVVHHYRTETALDGPMHEFMHDFTVDNVLRREIKPAAAVSLLLNLFVNYFTKFVIETCLTFSDAGISNPDDYNPHLETFKDDWVSEETVAIGGLKTGMTFRNASTSRHHRIVPVDLLAQLAADRFPDGALGLNNGCSIMLGDLFMHHKQEFADSFKLGRVTYAPALGELGEDLTAKANALVARPAVIRHTIGVDSTPYYYERGERSMYDRGNTEFALAGLRPSERNNPAYMAEVRSLIGKKQPGSEGYAADSKVTFHFGDLLDDADLAEFKEAHPDPLDFIVMTYLTQELSEANQARMHQIVNSLASDRALIVYIHQSFLIGGKPGAPRPYDWLIQYDDYATEPWRSVMHFTDKLNPHDREGVQEGMTFYDNSCQQVRLGRGQLVVNGKLVPIHDLVRNTS